MPPKIFFLTGAAGFIGSNLAHCLTASGCTVVVLDKLTYAGNLASLEGIPCDRLLFVNGDICDTGLVYKLLMEHSPDGIFHLAAESHVDRSIDSPAAFIETNILGTYSMLQAALRYYETLGGRPKSQFRFLHVSTDEVYGSLGETGLFTETTPYAPTSPYSASKASSDHLVNAWFHTYGLPVITTNCSNNYGPRQFPEKLIPLVVQRALSGQDIPVYGDGKNVRDWLYVEDHCKALQTVMLGGRSGAKYNIGGSCELRNIDAVRSICSLLDEVRPKKNGEKHENRIKSVADRPGHDKRYAMDTSLIKKELGWHPMENFATGIRKTVMWYLENQKWVSDVTKKTCRP